MVIFHVCIEPHDLNIEIIIGPNKASSPLLNTTWGIPPLVGKENEK